MGIKNPKNSSKNSEGNPEVTSSLLCMVRRICENGTSGVKAWWMARMVRMNVMK